VDKPVVARYCLSRDDCASMDFQGSDPFMDQVHEVSDLVHALTYLAHAVSYLDHAVSRRLGQRPCKCTTS